MSLGKSIRIYLEGGDVTGVRYAEVVNWTGQAVVLPRSRLAELAAWSNALKRPGVYFLVGAERPMNREVYIGESETVADRLQQHIDKEFWQEAIVITSKDENLTKSHIKYLESRLIELAKAAGRYSLQNGNQPSLTGLPRPDRDAMEEFLGHLRLLLGALGHRLLEPLLDASPANSKSAVTKQLSFSVRQALANAMITDEGIVVLKGSTALSQINRSLGNYASLRDELTASGKLVAQDNNVLVFQDDVLFTSPSAAAAIISGSSTNGRTAWHDAEGRTLKELEEAQANA